VATTLVIMGLPRSGKSTVFNALTRAEAATGTYGAADEPNLATVKVPDARLDTLTAMFKPQRKVPADVQYLDVAGMAKGIAEKGMSGALLNNLARRTRCSTSSEPSRTRTSPTATARSTRSAISKRSTSNCSSPTSVASRTGSSGSRASSQAAGPRARSDGREKALMETLKSALEADTPLREVLGDIDPDDLKTMRGFGFLSAKPLLLLLNLGEDQLGEVGERVVSEVRERFERTGVGVEGLAGQIEMEIGRLEPDDAAVFMADLAIVESGLDRVIRRSFDLLGLMPFFTSARTNAGRGRSGGVRRRSRRQPPSTRTSPGGLSGPKSSPTTT
jgi:ribosome-binding ATPase YchF (GTP1/OBG family)